LDRIAWIFMRVSGVLLVGLIFTHLMVNLMQDGGVKAIDFAFVAGKLADPFWQWFDVTLLWLARSWARVAYATETESLTIRVTHSPRRESRRSNCAKRRASPSSTGPTE
jgi:hypothetical protein